jgi:predicted metalloendopeptidase
MVQQTVLYSSVLTVAHRDQLFFLAFGRIWAENIKPEALVQRVRTDPHSPNQFRVDGTLHNVPEFAKAFNCSSKAKVRCSVNPPDMSSHELFSLIRHRRNDAFFGHDL